MLFTNINKVSKKIKFDKQKNRHAIAGVAVFLDFTFQLLLFLLSFVAEDDFSVFHVHFDDAVGADVAGENFLG